MAKKFDVYEALKQAGFEEGKTDWGSDVLKKTFTKMVEVVWYGQMKSSLEVEAYFNRDHTSLKVFYSSGDRKPFKEKAHLNEKRAYNAIAQTISNNGYTI